MIIFEFRDVEFQKDINRLHMLWNFMKFLFRKENKNKEMLLLAVEKGGLDSLFSHDRYFVAGLDRDEAIVREYLYRRYACQDTTPATTAGTTTGPTQAQDVLPESTTPASPAQ
jgi:hypothetical protein